MKYIKTFQTLSVFLAVQLSLSSAFALNSFKTVQLQDWLEFQRQVSTTKLQQNISPHDGQPGSVIASPQRKDPDYYSHWVRDAALTMDVVLHLALTTRSAAERQLWESDLRDFVYFSRNNQLSEALTNLGEPKFYVDGRPFMGPWGRPQNDGPALRASTLARWAMVLLDRGEAQFVRTWLYAPELPAATVIKADLEYVSHRWREKSFDLWEEVKADHFYTLMVQRRSLLDGAKLADRLQDNAAAVWYRQQAKAIEAELNKFWDSHRHLIRVSMNRVEGVDYKNSDLDIAVLLSVLHGGFDEFFGISDARVIATFQKLEKAFAQIYPVNHRQGVPGFALGRYPEDRYSGSSFDGGNPWVLSTAAAAEYLYKLSKNVMAKGSFVYTSALLGVLSPKTNVQLRSLRLKEGQKVVHPQLVTVVAQDLAQRGDEYLERIKYHANPDGSLSEQINRFNGFMISARDLTWSYASYLTALWAREQAALKVKFKKEKK